MPKKSAQGKRLAARREGDRETAKRIIETIVQKWPVRKATSPEELSAQVMMQAELQALGLSTRFEPFRFNDNLHANMVLHFGLGVLGTAVSGLLPAAGLALHAVSSGSYYADITRRGYLLRRLLGFKKAANLLAVAPATEPVRKRIVFVSHADAGYTGWVFDPRVIHLTDGGPRLLGHPIALATRAMAALTGFDALRVAFGPLTLPLRPIEWMLTVPAMMTVALNTQILIKNTIVPGANDNLSSVAALPILAGRLLKSKPADTELVFVVSSSEEAHLGGADALAHQMEGEWEKDRTVVIALDGITNGNLNFIEAEGEVTRLLTPAWLTETAESVAAKTGMTGGIGRFEPPAGGTDAAPFLARGYNAIAFVCIDPAIGAPRHYHQPSDTPENLDYDQLMRSIDFVEAFAKRIIGTGVKAP
jgi:hypothetical protein